jgi:hypothetical protein
MPSATPGRSFRAVDVAGEQSHELADMADQARHIKDHLAGGTTLTQNSIDHKPHAPIDSSLPVHRGVARKGPKRSKSVRAPSLDPLPVHSD